MAARYREASAEVMEVLSRFAAIERASIDEAYLDLTGCARDRLRELRGRPLAAELLPTTFVQGLPASPDPQHAAKGRQKLAPLGSRWPGRSLMRWGCSNSLAARDEPAPAAPLRAPHPLAGHELLHPLWRHSTVTRISVFPAAKSPASSPCSYGCMQFIPIGLVAVPAPLLGSVMPTLIPFVSPLQRSCGSEACRNGWPRSPSMTPTVPTCS